MLKEMSEVKVQEANQLRVVVCPFVLFAFGHCVVCSSSIYGFLLPHWYLQTILIEKRHTRLDEINDLFNSITVNIKSFRVSIKYPDMIVMID
jgi:hypothetical protein